MPCTRKQAETINRAFSSMPEMFRGFGGDKVRLFNHCLAGERDHRSGHPTPRGFSAQLAARYFAVKWLREYVLKRDRLPSLRDYLHIRQECFFAAACSLEHESEALTVWAQSIDEEFDSLDYAQLME